jgi:MFS transporter, DHA1 family, tetracycline resistance protein
LAAVGVVSVAVQGFLMGRLLKRFPPQRLAIMRLISSAMAYAMWGAASEGWMMFAVIGVNLLGGTVAASVQSLISSAADSRSQGQTLGAVNSLKMADRVMLAQQELSNGLSISISATDP